MDVIETILVALIVAVFAREFEAWLPWATEQTLRLAVRCLPPELRDRYDEEWRADVEAVPGTLSKLCWALGLIRAAHHMKLRANLRAISMYISIYV